jgi:hypothetical protein
LKRNMHYFHLKSNGDVKEMFMDEYWKQIKANQKRKYGWLLANCDLTDGYLYVSNGKKSLILNVQQLQQVFEKSKEVSA